MVDMKHSACCYISNQINNMNLWRLCLSSRDTRLSVQHIPTHFPNLKYTRNLVEKHSNIIIIIIIMYTYTAATCWKRARKWWTQKPHIGVGHADGGPSRLIKRRRDANQVMQITDTLRAVHLGTTTDAYSSARPSYSGLRTRRDSICNYVVQTKWLSASLDLVGRYIYTHAHEVHG